MNTPVTAAPVPAVAPRPVPPAILQRLEEAVGAAKAPATRRAYRTAWQAWQAWCSEHGAEPLPASPDAVAAYLAQRAADGAGMATLRMACSAISAVHARAARIAAGSPAPWAADPRRFRRNPCTDPMVRDAMKGFARQAADAGKGAPRQARGLTAEAVAAIRGSLGGRAEDTYIPARDMALVSVLACAGLRRSEAAALTWGDVEIESDGSGRVHVRRSKTDQDGAGATVAVTADAVRDLERLASIRGSRADGESVFGLSDRQIGRRIAAVARDAGLGDGYSGHSGRVGMAMRMTRNGAPAAAVMRQGRWQSVRMVASYTRSESAGEALRYL